MIVSRPEFLRRFVKAFGEQEVDEQYLCCFRTKMPDGGYFYAAPFVVSKPLDLYYHLCNVDGVVLDKLVEQSADVVLCAYWFEDCGISCDDFDEIAVPFADLYLVNEEVID